MDDHAIKHVGYVLSIKVAISKAKPLGHWFDCKSL